VDANYREAAQALNLSRAELATLARNSFESSWLSPAAKARWLGEIDRLSP
jgi:adenosine deaminase